VEIKAINVKILLKKTIEFYENYLTTNFEKSLEENL
jgi:hypothetical protein